MAALEVDLSKIEMGQTVTVKWRGKPVFVRRRSEQEVEAAGKVRPPRRTPPCCTAAHVSVVTAEPGCRMQELLHRVSGCIVSFTSRDDELTCQTGVAERAAGSGARLRPRNQPGGQPVDWQHVHTAAGGCSAQQCSCQLRANCKPTEDEIDIPLVTSHPTLLPRSGWWSWVCAHTWAVSRCPTQATGTAGSALAMAGKFRHSACRHLLPLTVCNVLQQLTRAGDMGG